MSHPVAIVTGGASGIGLAVTKHLLSRGYKVMIVDVNVSEGTRVSEELGSNTSFTRCDVSKYAEQAAMFAKTFEWGGNRLDFLAANAGIDDRQSLIQPTDTMVTDEAGLPQEPNLITMRVDLDAVMYGIWLFRFFSNKSRPKSSGGKIVITASAAGLYGGGIPTNTQYVAAKYGLVGLTRSIGPWLVEKESISVNCICPAFVITNLAPPGLIEKFPKEHITPMSTVIKAYNEFLDNDGMSGETVELSQGEIYFRKPVAWANESQRWLGEDSMAFWAEAYKDVPKARHGV